MSKQTNNKNQGKSSQNSKNKTNKPEAKPNKVRNKRFTSSDSSKVSSKQDGTKRSDRLSPLNDFEWYNKNPNLTIAAGSIPYPYRPGMDLQSLEIIDDTEVAGVAPWRIPGVMCLQWLPSIGQSSNVTDPASIAAKEIFAKVRQVFSGSIEADPPDFVIYLLALDSIFSYIGSLKRLYRVASTYSPENRAIPDVLLDALGVGAPGLSDALRRDKMKLFQVINELVGMTQKFKCPAVFDVFNRHYWMNDNVYTDAPQANSQLYVFYQIGFFQYDLLETPDSVLAGGLSLAYPAFNLSTPSSLVDDMYDFGVSLISALAESDDAYIISGYLQRAYEDYPSFSVDPLEMNELFTPVFVPEVLLQIKNSATLGILTCEGINAEVTQDPTTNTLIHQPVGAAAGILSFNPMISIPAETPTIEMTIEATRLQAWVDPNGSVVSCGTEIPLNWRVHWSNDFTPALIQQRSIITPDWTAAGARDFILNYSLASQFYSAPLIAIAMYADDDIYVLTVLSDVSNVTTFSPEQLKQMHKICLYSEFNSFAL